MIIVGVEWRENMLEYNLFGYEVEIDKNATTAWYTASNVWGCECGDCRNFLALAQKRAFPLPVLQILDMLNIPPEKATSESFCQGGAWIFFILLTQILSLLLPE